MGRALRFAIGACSAVAINSLILPASAGAQLSCAPAARASVPPPTSEVLDRRVSLHGREVALREALDRLAAAARIHLSYSAELLDLSRPVCLEYESAPVGRVLENLLEGARVHPVVLGADQIVLTPVRDQVATTVTPPTIKSVSLLDRVVVTGSTIGASQRSLPIALDVVSGPQLAQRAAGALSGALDGVVPGLWLWEQSPISLLARYGSIRGASSFGVSYPKVYVDGIEAANSLLVTHLDPESVSRIEVIRGPQGAALYGADAISGVMNIVTRQEGNEAGSPRAQIHSEGGASSSDYTPNSVLTQSHAVSLRTGTNVRSARFGMTLTSIGAFIPGASSQQLTANGGGRLVRSRGVVTGTMRVFAQDARTPASPVIAGLDPLSRLAVLDSTDRQSVRQFTIGATGTFAQSDRWTHTAVFGVDGYRLRSATILDGAFPSALDSALRAATGSAVRTTLRASSVGQFGDPSHTAATVTLGAEHSFIRDRTVTQNPFVPVVDEEEDDSQELLETRTNAGIIGQVSASFDETFFVNGGVRIERNSGLAGFGSVATLPMLGASAVRSLGIATLKIRGAYGKGIRPAQTSSRSGALPGLQGVLSPEEQAGVEAGADLFVGSVASIHATRFVQRASGLIQPVSVYSVAINDGMPRYRGFAYELQNVGEISNRGWELATSVHTGAWTLGATWAQVDSRVRKLAERYTGDLRPGDRMLEVPSQTFGLNAAFAQNRWTMSWRVSRASDWINYDRVALLSAFASQNGDPRSFVGPELRSYWRTYDGVTRLGGRLAVEVSRGMTFTFDGENLLDEQRGEPDNITVLPGRTLSAGLRLSF